MSESLSNASQAAGRILSPLPSPAKGEWFLKGPIPGDWLGRAAQMSGRSLHLGLAIWHLAFLEQTPTVSLTKRIRKRLGVEDKDAARRALAKLESAGLIRVERNSGRAPRVTILDPRETE